MNINFRPKLLSSNLIALVIVHFILSRIAFVFFSAVVNSIYT